MGSSLQAGKDSREVAAYVCWWTAHATEELSNLDITRGETKEMDCVSPRTCAFIGLSLWRHQRQSRKSPKWSKQETHAEKCWKHMTSGIRRLSDWNETLQRRTCWTPSWPWPSSVPLQQRQSVASWRLIIPLPPSSDEPLLEPEAQCWAPSRRQWILLWVFVLVFLSVNYF